MRAQESCLRLPHQNSGGGRGDLPGLHLGKFSIRFSGHHWCQGHRNDSSHNKPSPRLAAGLWAILMHPPRSEDGVGTWAGDRAGEMEKTPVRAAASAKGYRKEREGMEGRRGCRKGPKRGPRWWGTQRTSQPLLRDALQQVQRRLCSSRQEALDPAELLQRSVHVNQLDRQRGEKQGDEIRG